VLSGDGGYGSRIPWRISRARGCSIRRGSRPCLSVDRATRVRTGQ
jgi:hypothetical protein